MTVSAANDGEVPVVAFSAIDKMAFVMKKLVQRVESLESKLNQQSTIHYGCADKNQSVTMQRRWYQPFWPAQRGPMNQSNFRRMCWKCLCSGHIVNNDTKISTLPSDECLKLQCMIGKEPIVFLLDSNAPVTLLRRDTWNRINSKPQILYNLGRDTDGWELMVHQCKSMGSA